MSCVKRSKPKRTAQRVPGDDNKSMQQHRHILLVLIIAVVAVQTKDLSNIILNFDETTIDNVTIYENETISTTESNTPLPSIPRSTAAPHPSIPLQLLSNDSNIADGANSTIVNIQTVPYSLELPKKSIDKILNDEDHIPSNQTYEHAVEIPNTIIHQLLSLPTPIVPRRTLTIQRTPLSKENSANNGRSTAIRSALRLAAIEGLEAMNDLYDRKEPNLLRKGLFLPHNHPGARLSAFGAPTGEANDAEKGAFAALYVAKKMKNVLKWNKFSRQAPPKISLRRTPLEQFCPPQNPPRCPPFAARYRTHDGTCNNARKPRWGAAHMPFHRYLAPAYNDGIEELRRSVVGGALPSARFISLLAHGSRESDSPVTHMLAQYGQFIDHDLTFTAQPRPTNGSIVQCCGVRSIDLHPSCAPIKVPIDDPWLAPIGVRCLEFIRSAPAQRPDCLLSWREQTNQVTSYLDASTIYGSSPRSAEDTRTFDSGQLLYGRGPPRQDACMRGAMANQCIRPGDGRSGEQPGLLAMHHIWAFEHNQVALELADLNPHWSDEKLYQEARRIVGAMVQHITYREFLPLVLGRDVCQLFDLELEPSGYYKKYDVKTNPTVANAFSAAAFRFGHALIQSSYMRSTINNEFLDNNVTLHEELAIGDIGGAGSLHRLLRGLAMQRAQKRDEFITAELTNHLFQQDAFRFGNDLAAVNIQRGRDHGIPAYTQWREPCGLSPIRDWDDFDKIVGPASARRIRQGYQHVDDIDLFVAGLAERPVVGGLVGPVFACIIAQQFSNLRKGDRFWYENDRFESSFTPAQLQSIRQVLLSQVICRTLVDGTLQPHVFLPHDIDSNERLPCGSASLAPIDLKPWLERDPFLKELSKPDPEASTVRNDDRKDSADEPDVPMQPIKDRIDFPANNLQISIRPINFNKEPLIINATIINNKLDLSANARPVKGQSALIRPQLNRNKVVVTTSGQNIKIKKSTRPTVATTTKRTVKRRKTATRRPTTANKNGTTDINKKKNKRRNHVQKRDLSNNKESRGAIVLNVDGKKSYSTVHRKNDDKKQFLIVTPDGNDYEIEINIRPNKKSQKTTAIPFHTWHQSHSSSGSRPTTHSHLTHNTNDDLTINNRPTYFGMLTKRPQTQGVRYGVTESDEIITTKRPYYQYDHTTKRPPNTLYYLNHDDIVTTRRPQYNRPSFVQSDNSGYGGSLSGSSSIPQSDSGGYRPSGSVSQFDSGGYRPSSHDVTSKPLYSYEETYNVHQDQRPQSSYANRPSHDDNNIYQYRPSPTTLNDHNSYGGASDDEQLITTRPKPQTSFSYNSQSDHQPNRPSIYYLNDDWDKTTTQRPQIVTYYSVMTTRKRRRTRPTQSISSYLQTEQDDTSDDDDDDDDDEDQDEGITSTLTAYLGPTSLITNVVSTFSDYFAPAVTTTRRPYIQHDPVADDEDEWNGNPYAQYSPSSDFPYSRQKDVNVYDDNDRRKASMQSAQYDPLHSRDNDLTTLQTDNIHDSTNETTNDPYWYLRATHTKYDQQENLTFDNYSDTDKTFPKTEQTRHSLDIERTTFGLRYNTTARERHGLIRHKTNDTKNDMKSDNEQNTTTERTNRRPKARQPILFAPLKVLTSPERPDNWVMYHAMEKVPLPKLPTLNLDNAKISNEMPRPITLRPEKKRTNQTESNNSNTTISN